MRVEVGSASKAEADKTKCACIENLRQIICMISCPESVLAQSRSLNKTMHHTCSDAWNESPPRVWTDTVLECRFNKTIDHPKMKVMFWSLWRRSDTISTRTVRKGGGGGGGFYLESKTIKLIPHEVKASRCRTTPASKQSANEAHLRAAAKHYGHPS